MPCTKTSSTTLTLPTNYLLSYETAQQNKSAPMIHAYVVDIMVFCYVMLMVAMCARNVARWLCNLSLRKRTLFASASLITSASITFTNVSLNSCLRSLQYLNIIWRAFLLRSGGKTSQPLTKQTLEKYSDI